MSESRIHLAIVGCGGMGHRHLYGLAELTRAGLSPFELVGACDPVEENAASLADQAQKLLGRRPATAGSLEALAAAAEVHAIDLTTTPRAHHTVAAEAFGHGWHVMCEKPLGLTARACGIMVEAAAASGRVLSTAENYRRDPMNRLGKALLDAGVIGEPRLMLQHSLGGGDAVLHFVEVQHLDRSSDVFSAAELSRVRLEHQSLAARLRVERLHILRGARVLGAIEIN